MELFRLRTFIAVAEEGHLTRAAKRLFTSQPAVSSHIKTLEEELGVTLFHRTPKGMELTSEGNKLKLKAEKALHAIDDLVFQAKSLKTTLSGTLRLGLNINPVLLKIGELLSLMIQKHPGIEFRMNPRMSWEAIEDLKKGDLDACFIMGNNRNEEINTLPLRKINLVIAAPASWEDKIKGAGWKEIAKMPWIWTSQECACHEIGHELFQKDNLSPSAVAFADDEYILQTLIEAEVGMGILFEEQALESEKKGKITVWKKETMPPAQIFFAYLKTRENDPVIQATLGGLKQVWGKM